MINVIGEVGLLIIFVVPGSCVNVLSSVDTFHSPLPGFNVNFELPASGIVTPSHVIITFRK